MGSTQKQSLKKEEFIMLAVMNERRGIGMIVSFLLISLILASIFTPAMAYGGASGTNTTSASGSGGKSFDDALNLIGDDGKINYSSTIATGSTEGGLNGFIAKYKSLISGVCGVLSITMILFFILNVTKLSATADNDMARRKTINALLFSAISAVLMGGSSVFIGLFWNVLN